LKFKQKLKLFETISSFASRWRSGRRTTPSSRMCTTREQQNSTKQWPSKPFNVIKVNVIICLMQCFPTFFTSRNPYDKQKCLRDQFWLKKNSRNPLSKFLTIVLMHYPNRLFYTCLRLTGVMVLYVSNSN